MFIFSHLKYRRRKLKKKADKVSSISTVISKFVFHCCSKCIFVEFLGKKKKEFNPDAPKLDRVPFPTL
jgi:hypothetical protein